MALTITINELKNNVSNRIITDYTNFFCVGKNDFLAHNLFKYLFNITFDILIVGLCMALSFPLIQQKIDSNTILLACIMIFGFGATSYFTIKNIQKASYILKQKQIRSQIFSDMQQNTKQFLEYIESDNKIAVCGDLPLECMYSGCMLYVHSEMLLKLTNDEIAQLFQICSQKDRDFLNYIYNKKGEINYRHLELLKDTVVLNITHNSNSEKDLMKMTDLKNNKKPLLTIIKS